jgi:hypothetical protein
MSSKTGPRLAGIGRSGDSDIVLCMDAHDAGSYPGEPTTNYIKHVAAGFPNGWWGDGGNQSLGTKGPSSVFDSSLWYNNYPTVLWTPGTSKNCYLNGTADIPQDVLSTEWIFSCYIKAEDGGTLRTSDNDLGVYLYHPSTGAAVGTTVDVGNGWYRVFRSVSGSSNYIGLAGFYDFRAEKRFYLSGAQLEKKTYTTPYVTGFTNSGYPDTEVYDGRPSYTSLMIHGDVGTGQNFSDSSPSKHIITANGHVTHSNAQSKFSGGAIYFDGSVDSLTTNSSSDFAFGTGDFTIDCWVYKTATEDFETYFDTYSYSGNGFLCGLWSTASTMSFYSEGGIGWTSAGGTAVALNTWTHLAWVRDGNTLRMFVDGVQQGTATLSSSDDYTSTYLRIGGRLTDEFIFGYMDEMRVTQGTALWTTTFNPPTRRNVSAPLVDLSGNYSGGNFATTDSTDVKTNRKGQVIEPIANAYWNFDGTDDSISLGGTTGAASARPLNAYPFTFTAWVISDTGWSPVSGQDELLNMNIAGQRVSLGIMNNSGWGAYGPSIMYGGTNHWSCAASAFGSPTGWTHIAYVIYGSNNSSHKIYINGIPQVLTNNGGAHGGTAGLTVRAVNIGLVTSLTFSFITRLCRRLKSDKMSVHKPRDLSWQFREWLRLVWWCIWTQQILRRIPAVVPLGLI